MASPTVIVIRPIDFSSFDLNLNFRIDPKYWMDKIIFHYKPSDISEIILKNNNLNENFYLKSENDQYILKVIRQGHS